MTFLKRYVYAFIGCLYLFFCGFLFRRNRRLIQVICEHFGYDWASEVFQNQPPLAVIPILPEHSGFESESEIIVAGVRPRDGNVTLEELVTLCQMLKRKRPNNVFEIGTFDGRTSLNLALNSPEETKIYTLDLPKEEISTTTLPLAENDAKFINKASSGQLFQGKYKHRIIQLLGDSARFDFSPYKGRMDFIFVDGAHSYEYVRSDSEVAMGLAGRGATIIWHDYGIWEGVTRALNELYDHDHRFSGLRRFANTTLVVLECP